MGNSKGRLAKLVSIPVLAVAGFLVAASIAGVGGASGTTVAFEGCTPGYWKVEQHHDSWAATGFTTSQTLESVFNVPDAFGVDNVSLVAAMSFGGGPTLTDKAKLLLHHAVAALLNSAHPDVDYPRTTAEVIADVNAALASGSASTMTALKNELDADNNLGCPLN